MPREQIYVPQPLNPLQARFLNLLTDRDYPREFEISGKPCSFAPDPWQRPFTAQCGLDLDVGGEAWQIQFASTAPINLHPVGECIGDPAALPEGLRLALLELALGPLLAALADFFGLEGPVTILAEGKFEQAEFACAVPLLLHLPDVAVPMTVSVPGQGTAETVLQGLRSRPLKPGCADNLPVAVALEAGSARLSLRELRALACDDIILPEQYPAQEGKLWLRLAKDRGIFCSLAEGQATVLGFAHNLPPAEANEARSETMDEIMPETGAEATEAGMPDAPAPETVGEAQAPDGGLSQVPVDLDGLEMTVSFELGRQLMTVAEIAALTPGYTFALAADLTAPVQLRVNGQILGSGRLVDVGGALGVQLVSLNTGK